MIKKFVPLSEIVILQGGGTPSKKKPEYWGGIIPWATVKDFKGKYLSETKDQITEAGLKNSSTRIIPKGTVIIPTRMALGKAAINNVDLAINQDLKALIPKQDISTGYLFYAILNLANEIERKGAGSTVKGITIDALYKLKIFIPEKKDQIRIATLLSKVESLIAKRKKSIADLDELLKSTFLEMFGDPVRNEMGWVTLPLTKTGEFLSGGTPSKKRSDFWQGGFPWISPKDMKTNYLFDSQDHISDDVFRETTLKKVEKNNVLIVVRGMILAHSFPVAINRCPVAINQDMKAIKPRKEYNPTFFMSCLVAMERQILSLISSAAHGTRRFDSIAMQKVLVPKPPLGLQNQFTTIVEKVETLKKKYQKSLNDLETLYDTLSQKAFKGELDLNRIPVVHHLEAEGIVTLKPIVSKPTLTVQDKPDKAPETREQTLHRLFNGFISDAKNSPLSLDDFWLEVEEKLIDLMDEEAPPLGVADYDRVRDWLFDMLAQGSVAQVFNEQENRMEIRSVS